MALKYIIGDFASGSISEANELAVIKGSDKISIDINAGDSATLQVSLNDNPNWKTTLKPLEKFVALVDDTLPWESAVIWAGFINKNVASVKGTIDLQLASLREYLSLRIITDIYDASSTNPNAGVSFTANTWQGIQKKVIEHCFSTSGIPVGSPVPPNVLGTVYGDSSGASLSYKVQNSNFLSYSQALEEIKNEYSSGEEYFIKARWENSSTIVS